MSVHQKLFLVPLALSLALASGCECDPVTEASITLTAPADGTTLTLADDTNEALEGLQIEVTADIVGLGAGDELGLRVDGATASTAFVGTETTVRFTDVTLSSGSHTLQAFSVVGGVTSQEVTVTVNADCFAVNIVTPEPGGDVTTLGPADDTDGEMCEGTFETTVVASTGAPDGSEARVYVNGTPRRTARVMGGAVRFEGVAFDNRGPTPNTLRVEVSDPDGLTCDTTFGTDILVDCDGVSCAITLPDSESPFLNESDDLYAADGFQTDFEVTTDADGAGQPVRLIIDGDSVGALTATPDGLVARFTEVELSEGVHRVRAQCVDEVGNVSFSGTAEWTVDVTPCGVAFVEPTEGQLFNTDLDESTPEFDILSSGTAGADCVDLRVGACGGIDALPFGTASETWEQPLALATTAMQQVCVETRDEAGNVSREMVGIRIRTEAPQLEIASPSAGAGYNVMGTAGRTADLDPGTPSCEAMVEVYCTDPGEMVTLLRETPSTVIGMASCVADAGVPAPYAGIATFTMAALPTQSDGMPYNILARQEADGLTGTSSPISVRADCDAPNLTVTRPMCGAMLRPATQDEDMSTPGFQYRTNVAYTNGRMGDSVVLEIRPTGGGAPVSPPIMRTFTSSPLVFNGVDYASGGMLDIIATATDSGGNVASNPTCSVTVEDLPTVTLTAPMDGEVLSTGDDCDGGAAGLQVRVQGTTDSPAGSTVAVVIGGSTTMGTVGSGGAIDECVSISDGSRTIRVEVTDTRGTGSASVAVTVDTMPPTTAIDDLSATVTDRRGGLVRLDWTAVADAGGGDLTAYELRCAAAPITSEADWTAATPVPVMSVPGSGGSSETEVVGGFRPGVTRNCALRGEDPTGAMTPLPASSTTITVSFLQQEVTSGTPTASRFGVDVAAVGDVNGDGIDDVLVGGQGEAFLYFGSATGLGATASVSFPAAGGSLSHGREVAGLGDFNGDGRPDFAITDRELTVGGESFQGAVYVFFGRPSTTPWPSTVATGATGPGPFVCSGADLCFVGDDGVPGSGADTFGLLGWSVAPAGDFDGDGFMDLAIGAPFAGGSGRAYIMLGDSSFTSGSTISVPGTGSGPQGFFVQATGAMYSQLGNVVESLGGDLGADMRHDILIGAAGRTGGSPIPAAVLFLGGRAHAGGGLTSIAPAGLQVLGTGQANSFGIAMSGAGDINGDGILDALVYENALNDHGRVTAYLGSATGFTGATTFTYTNDTPGPSNDRFGRFMSIGRHPALMLLSDIDGDRISDVVLGSVESETMPGTSALFYRSMSSSPQVRSARDVQFGSASTTAATDGFRPTFVGDVNGDGAADIAIADPAFMSNQGRVLVQY